MNKNASTQTYTHTRTHTYIYYIYIYISYTRDLLANEVWFTPDEPLSPRTPVSTCVARVTEYMFNDKELAGEPWRSSARYSHTDVFYDFGAEIDFLVSDKRSYSFMLKYVMSEVWNTSIRTKDAIVFEEPERIKYNSRITHVYWDPQGKKDVTIVYCVTKKEGQHKYPCIDQQRYTERAKNFISTLTVGSLRKSLECERAIVWNTTMNAKQCATAGVFTPPLYKQKKLQTTLDHVKMGTLTKIYIQFKQRFWSDGVETFLTPFNSSGYTCDAVRGKMVLCFFVYFNLFFDFIDYRDGTNSAWYGSLLFPFPPPSSLLSYIVLGRHR